MSDNPLDTMLDLRILDKTDVQLMTELTLQALFDNSARDRRTAINDLCDTYPVIGAYAHNNRIILYLESENTLHLGFLGDIPEKYQRRKSHPFYEANE